MALLQSLSADKSGPNSEKYKNKKEKLIALLDSDSGFWCIKMLPVTSDPDKKPMPQPVTSVVQPKPTVSNKTKQPVRKTKITTVKGINYDPEIDFDEGMSTIGGVTDFSRNADHIRIYIDEAWPKLQEPAYDNIGVISGIVWLGNVPSYEVLPAVPTHLRENFAPKDFREAISNLLNCSDMAFPFAAQVPCKGMVIILIIQFFSGSDGVDH